MDKLGAAFVPVITLLTAQITAVDLGKKAWSNSCSGVASTSDILMNYNCGIRPAGLCEIFGKLCTI